MFSIHSSPIGILGKRDTGGMSVYVRAVAQDLGQQGHAIDIYTGRSNGDGQVIQSLGENVKLIRLGNGNGRDISPVAMYQQLPDFFQDLETFRNRHAIEYDVIHSHYWLSGCLGHMAQERWQRPHVVTFHTLAAVKNSTGIGSPEPALRLTTERKLAGECHLIVSSTEQEKGQLNRFYNVAPERIVVVPCGVDLNLFRPVGKPEARRKLGYPREESILLYVGRFEPLKGIDRLLEAAAILARQRKVRVVLVGGDGPRSTEEKRLRKAVRAFGLQNHVTFAGRIEQYQLPLYYSAADVLVVSSHYESFGLVVLESLACGTPVVATPVGAIESLLVEGRSGYVLDNADSETLAAGIERVLFIPETGRTPMTPNDIRATVRHRSWSTVAATLSQEYTNICTSEGRT
jgi:D-inositol-3-phosphate glycosyltransferase